MTIATDAEYAEGGIELLTDAEVDFIERVIIAFVEEDRAVLDAIGAYARGSDPYIWTHNFREHGTVHLVVPPGAISDWPIDVMKSSGKPHASFLVVDMWTLEEGPSDLSLEINLFTDPVTGVVGGEYLSLHVM